jgi:hypothetical protein
MKLSEHGRLVLDAKHAATEGKGRAIVRTVTLTVRVVVPRFGGGGQS